MEKNWGDTPSATITPGLITPTYMYVYKTS